MKSAEPRSAAVDLDRLRSEARQIGVPLDDNAIAAIERFLSELRQWAPRTNLVAVGDLPNVVERHVLDSLAAAPLLRLQGGELSFIDVGSGAGFPGVPLAIALRPSRALLVEPRRRRGSFLRAVARQLPEVSIEIADARFEDLIDVPSSFDAVVSRASLSSASLLETSGRLLRPGGLLVVFRGPGSREPHGRVPSAPRALGRGAAPGATTSGGLFVAADEIEYRLPSIPSPLRLEVWRRTAVPRETPG